MTSALSELLRERLTRDVFGEECRDCRGDECRLGDECRDGRLGGEFDAIGIRISSDRPNPGGDKEEEPRLAMSCCTIRAIADS